MRTPSVRDTVPAVLMPVCRTGSPPDKPRNSELVCVDRRDPTRPAERSQGPRSGRPPPGSPELSDFLTGQRPRRRFRRRTRVSAAPADRAAFVTGGRSRPNQTRTLAKAWVVRGVQRGGAMKRLALALNPRAPRVRVSALVVLVSLLGLVSAQAASASHVRPKGATPLRDSL